MLLCNCASVHQYCTVFQTPTITGRKWTSIDNIFVHHYTWSGRSPEVLNKDCFTHERSNPCEDIYQTIVKRRTLQRYGHVSRSSGLAKTIFQGTVKGGRRQGRQRKRREDNIREWTGLEFGRSQRAVENRGEWRKLVAKSSVEPQRPLRLRDRWWWWWWWHSCVTNWPQ